MFIDTVTLTLIAGRGGNGLVSWRREKYIPKGGPSGGDGGKGGSIIIESDKDLYCLQHLRNYSSIKAKNGKPGGPNQCTGKSGEDKIIKVPVGTLIKDAKSNEILYDLTEDGSKIVLCTGGIGGRGNAYFKSPTNQAPYTATEGKSGETLDIALELKLIADVGFIGMPNAGKSTLITALTDVPVKIAPYPFTTMQPNIAILYHEGVPIYLADIPGIIEDAHQDRGLGLSFLRHIERTSILIYVIDISGMEEREPWDDFTLLQKELRAYNPELLHKPSLIVLNKIDQDPTFEKQQSFIEKLPSHYCAVSTSAIAKEGIDLLGKKIKDLLTSLTKSKCSLLS